MRHLTGTLALLLLFAFAGCDDGGGGGGGGDTDTDTDTDTDADTDTDTDEGTLSWAVGAGLDGEVLGFGIHAFSDGSSAVAGYFTGTATFGTGCLRAW